MRSLDGRPRRAPAAALLALLVLLAPAAEPAWSAQADRSIQVRAAGGRLSVALHQAPLDAVLEAIGRATGIAVRAHGAAIHQTVSDRFDGLPIEVGLRRLLRRVNVAFVYAPPGTRGAGTRLVEVVVYPENRTPEAEAPLPAPAPPAAPAGERGAPEAPQEGVPPAVEQQVEEFEAAADRGAAGDAATTELLRLLADPEPAVRKRALEAAEVTQAIPADALQEVALGDPDPQVRGAAFAALLATAGADAAAAAAREGLRDPSPAARLAALELLGEQVGGAAGRAAAEVALGDPDPFVRAKAAELLEIFEEVAPQGEGGAGASGEAD